MKIIRLDEELLDYFGAMDYFDNLHCLVHPGSFALGATMQREDGTDEPAAILVAEVEDDALMIRWLYVKSEYRCCGIGSSLLQMCFQEARERKMKRVLSRISEEYLEAAPEWDPERFFMECLFEKEESVMKEYVLLVSDLQTSAEVKKAARVNAYVMPFADLTEDEKKSVRDQVGKELSIGFDEDLSYVFTKKGECKAALFVRRYGRVIYPFLLYGKEKSDKEMLVKAAFCDLKDLDPVSVFRVESSTLAGEEILETMCVPNKKYLISYREARMMAYEKLLKAENA